MRSIDGKLTLPAVCVLEMRHLLRLLVLQAVFWIVPGCSGSDDYLRLSGSTMGTQYRVTARCAASQASLAEAVTAELASVNGAMSTYDPESELSRFNAAPSGEWYAVSQPLAEVVNAAQTVSAQSGGAFDVTVGPLVNLWGFGPVPAGAAGNSAVPDADAVAAARRQIGYQSLQVRLDPPALHKDKSLYVDLSAIAKGHGVDRLVAVLVANACTDFLVDIGGEVRVQGSNPRGSAWRIGVEQPQADQYGGVERILEITDVAVATSGDYRNFVEIDNHRFSHTIDPRAGAPIAHSLASVTVIHATAMWADAYATAINVLGPEAGYRFAEQHGLAAYLLVHTPDGFEARYTAGLSDYFADDS